MLNVLRGKIAEQRLTQDEFADAIKLSRQTLSQRLKGTNEFKGSEIVRIIKYFESKGKHYTVEELFPELFFSQVSA